MGGGEAEINLCKGEMALEIESIGGIHIETRNRYSLTWRNMWQQKKSDAAEKESIFGVYT